jgi:hypothetical protein
VLDRGEVAVEPLRPAVERRRELAADREGEVDIGPRVGGARGLGAGDRGSATSASALARAWSGCRTCSRSRTKNTGRA